MIKIPKSKENLNRKVLVLGKNQTKHIKRMEVFWLDRHFLMFKMMPQTWLYIQLEYRIWQNKPNTERIENTVALNSLKFWCQYIMIKIENNGKTIEIEKNGKTMKIEKMAHK